jgi:hypothetical protein
VLVETEGYGGNAKVEVDGQRLTVRDALSAVDRPAPPGPIDDARFDVVVVDSRDGSRPLGANPERLTGLQHRWGWRYTGNGRVVALDPLRIDLGVLVLELPRASDGAQGLGDFVSVAIDQISLVRAAA